MLAPRQARNDSDVAQMDSARTVAQKRELADNRPEAVAQRKLAEMMNNSPRLLQQRALSDAIHNSPRMVAQRHEMNALFGGAVEPQGDGAMPAEASPAQREEKTNNTGLPNQLKSGIESLSGMSMDHVKVHYNSDKPALLQAHAYAQGNEIHLGAGQEKHLPHEAWHVVQQAQGRVRPTLQMKAGAVNDDLSLESEADRMGEKAAQFKGRQVERNLVPEESPEGGLTQRVAGFGAAVNDNAGLEAEADRMGVRAASRRASYATARPGRAAHAVPGTYAPATRTAVVQRRTMAEVMVDQRARERAVNDEKAVPGSLTTVGFEWDIAKTRDHSEQNPNVLQGMTHVELAKSADASLNNLPYALETDAGNVVEFVTPPFYVIVEKGRTLPDLDDLNDIKQAMQGALAKVVKVDESLGQLMHPSKWSDFQIPKWEQMNLPETIGWRNWSPNATSKQNIVAGLPQWQAITIRESTVSLEPQINIAAVADDYDEVMAAPELESRLGDNDAFVKKFRAGEKKMTDFVIRPALAALEKMKGSADPETGEAEAARKSRITRVLTQLAKVLAQHAVVPMIGELARHQKEGYEQGKDVTNPMRKTAGPPSYVKDMDSVWLKTDLFSYASSILCHSDWKLLGGTHGLLSIIKKQLTAQKLGEKNTFKELINYAALSTVVNSLATHADSLSAMREADTGAHIAAELDKIKRLRPLFNEHSDEILGVRQDTFIHPTVMRELARRLGHHRSLSVMEVRNTTAFLKWLETRRKAKHGQAKSSPPASSSVAEGPQPAAAAAAAVAEPDWAALDKE